jgi:hypothetical protein
MCAPSHLATLYRLVEYCLFGVATKNATYEVTR